jgi:hypothetical protein
MSPVNEAESEGEAMKERMLWTARMASKSKWTWMNQRTTATIAMIRVIAEDSIAMTSSTGELAVAIIEDGRTIGTEAEVAIVGVSGDVDTDDHILCMRQTFKHGNHYITFHCISLIHSYRHCRGRIPIHFEGSPADNWPYLSNREMKQLSASALEMAHNCVSISINRVTGYI